MSEPMLPVAILAGGLATRLRPLTEKIPKALLQVNGEPFIAHQLNLLVSKGISHVVICIGYLGEMIENFVGDGRRFGLRVDYSTDGPNLLGTGGALKRALPLLGEAFFVLYGDSYLSCDYIAIQNTFFQKQKAGLMTIFNNEGKWDKSNVEFDGKELLAYNKKLTTPKMHYIDYGLGIFKRSAFANIANNTVYDLADLYQLLLQQQQLAAYVVKERFYEVGSVTGLNELENYLSFSNS